MTNQTAKAQELARVVRHPVSFSRGILKEDLWWMQEKILEAISQPHAHVAVRACHASSKTRTAGDAVVWFMTCFMDSVVPTTAPTWNQVKLLLWKEIATAVNKSSIKYPDVFSTDWKFNKEHYATGISTTEAERFQGFHAPHVLIVIDEAPGVREEIFEAIEGIEAGGDVRILMLGNPTITSGRFYNAFGRNRHNWKTFTIDAFDTPNFVDIPGESADEKIERLLWWEEHEPEKIDEGPRPYMVTRRWVLQRYHEWGTSSPLWMARVRGRFPSMSETSLIALDWVELARYRAGRPGIHALGVDVARYGNDYTSFADLHGSQVQRFWRYQGRDTVYTFTQIQKEFQRDSRLVCVVDDTGVGGGVVDMCRAHDIPVVAFNGGESPVTNDDVANRLSEAYWSLSLAFKDGDISLSEDIDPNLLDILTEQLVGVEYKFNPKQKIIVMKKGMKEDRPSPDLGDALNMVWEAHRIEVNSPALTSLQVEPQDWMDAATNGYSSRDRVSFWGQYTQRGPLMAPIRTPQPVEVSATGRVAMLCPSCGQFAELKELGRVADTRNYQLHCRHCHLERVIQKPA